MFPVGVGQSLILKETIQFNAINKAVFLNKSHRFKSDPQYGEIMRRFRVGLATKEDNESEGNTQLDHILRLPFHQNTF